MGTGMRKVEGVPLMYTNDTVGYKFYLKEVIG
jgi:hypothetical protein